MPVPKPVWCVRARNRINRVPPSAERNERLHSSGFGERPEGNASENSSGLPSLPDLLDELESDTVDLNALEQLTQTLLEDIARDLESAAEKAADQESIPNEKDIPREMVGTSSEELEPNGSGMLDKEHDISEYLLLHHNYAKTERIPINPPFKKPQSNTRNLKCIRPKINTQSKPELSLQPENKIENQVLYAGDSNTVQIFVNDVTILDDITVDENINYQDSRVVLLDANMPFVINTNKDLSVPVSSERSVSPRSDLGYESLDSPTSNSGLEIWDPSVTELFPSLL